MKCPFCLGDGKKSKEHLFSKPICRAVGINRNMPVASFDPDSGTVGPIQPLDQRAIRLPCESCNSGWMSQLETDTGRTISKWTANPDRPLGNQGLANLTRWLIKTAFVFGYSEGGSRRVLETPTDVITPDITTARAVMDGQIPDHVRVAATRVNQAQNIWGTGNATVSPTGPDRISSRAVNVTALNLGQLQLWVVIPIVRPDALRLPQGVARLNPRLTFGSLRTRTGDLEPTAVTAVYSDATTAALFRALEAISQSAVIDQG